MKNSLFGNWEEYLTEEGIEVLNRMVDAHKSGGIEGLIEVVVEIASETRDDITKEEFIKVLKEHMDRQQFVDNK